MIYAIRAYEGEYCGLHGIEQKVVVECENLKEAEEIAADMAEEVIEDHFFEGYEEYDEEDFYDIHSREWEIYIVKEVDIPIDELDKMYYNDPEGFIEKFCEII